MYLNAWTCFACCLKCQCSHFTTVFVLFVLEEREKTTGKDEDVQTNIQEDAEHGQTSTKYLFTKYKPDVDSHGTHVYFTFK